MNIKFKKLSNTAVIPTFKKVGDAGADLTATSIIRTPLYIEYGTSIAIELPTNYVGLLFSRSSVTKRTLIMKNSVGVIDSGYRGEIKVRFYKTPNYYWLKLKSVFMNKNVNYVYNIGDDIAQLIIQKLPIIKFIEVNELSSTERNDGGFGHTDNETISKLL